MSKAIFVSINTTYKQIKEDCIGHEHEALRNCTCVSWRINPEKSLGVKYIFGVSEGQVVSAYKVDVPSAEWPELPGPSIEAGRRHVPADNISLEEWKLATRPKQPVPMKGPVLYGEVSDDGKFDFRFGAED